MRREINTPPTLRQLERSLVIVSRRGPFVSDRRRKHRALPGAPQANPSLWLEASSMPNDHGDGLHEDLVKLATRRDALRIFGAGSAAAVLTTLGATKALAATPTAKVPSETAGPYPGDGSNGPDVLDDSGIVRHDI